MTDAMAPSRKALFSAGEVGGIVGGACKGNLDALIGDVVVDSREVTPGALFVALAGENADGHDFIKSALESGASCILAANDRKEKVLASLAGFFAASGHIAASGPETAAPYKDACIIFVDSPLGALQALARDYRRRMKNLFRIGVTGSSGKTTTKECIGATLSPAYPEGALAMNTGNLNSDIGLALSMFSLDSRHEIGIFEMGMNRKGEMDELAAIFEPDLAVITNVGTAHVGMVGSRKGIAEEKKKIFSRFDGNQIGFIWEDDGFKDFLKENVRGRIEEFGVRSTKGLEKTEDRGLKGWVITWFGQTISFPLPGKHNLLNALAALSVAAELGVESATAARGLESVRPLFGRSEVFEGTIALIRDCYNANPDSVAAALDFCDSLEWRGRRVYVLGSMLELGLSSQEEHKKMGRRAADSLADGLFFFGEETWQAYEEALNAEKTQGAGTSEQRRRTIFHTNEIESLKRTVLAYLEKGDLVLAKASRGLELERLTDALFEAGFFNVEEKTAGLGPDSHPGPDSRTTSEKGAAHAS